MLRVGLTGELGSGKSTVARLLAAHGAHIFSSDEIGRALMQPSQPVFGAVVDRFGPAILAPDGTLDRPALAKLAFDPVHPRIEELNAIVHPAVLAEQERQLAALARTAPDTIAVIESALIFTTKHAGAPPWHTRFDRILLVTAPDDLKIARFLSRAAAGRTLTPEERTALTADARQRLAAQRIPSEAATHCILLHNESGIAALQKEVEALWQELQSLTTSQLKTHH